MKLIWNLQKLNLVFVAIAFALTSCASSPNVKSPITENDRAFNAKQITLSKITSFSIKGRIGIQSYKQGYSGSFLWTHKIAEDEIQMFSPLGSQVALIVSNPHFARLTTSEGKIYEDETPEALTKKVLGWEMPVNQLSEWVLGRVNSKSNEVVKFDELGRIQTIMQDEWQLHYDDFIQLDNIDLPKKLTLKNPKLNLKLLIETWSVNTNT